MEERKRVACWPWLLLGLLGLALLGLLAAYWGPSKASNLRDATDSEAQGALDTGGYAFASAEVDGAALRLTGTAPTAEARAAACAHATAALRERGMLGVPGTVARVECAITAPGVAGDAAMADTAPAAAEPAKAAAPAPAAPAIAEADRPAATNCQQRLSAEAATETVTFALNGAQITGGTGMLDRIATIAQECRRFGIEVGGHTDRRGGDGINVPLSQRRAEAVRTYLVGRGVAAEQLTARGYGSSRPVDASATGNDEPRNRRTEFTITALD
jgi:outer membrane protein OmpA-like peptidoglycan-associated protein